ncbi:MAG TPA: hypothetical protein VG318_14365 [Actinomycetota bacterium]|nr:hypothetical protein [Actinomycetota bacterium]
MDQDRNHPQPELRAPAAPRPRDRNDEIPGVPKPDELMRWVAAAFLAGAALLGLLVLASILAFALDPPVWIQVVLGVVMACGAVFFAWLVQSALRKDETQRRR